MATSGPPAIVIPVTFDFARATKEALDYAAALQAAKAAAPATYKSMEATFERVARARAGVVTRGPDTADPDAFGGFVHYMDELRDVRDLGGGVSEVEWSPWEIWEYRNGKGPAAPNAPTKGGSASGSGGGGGGGAVVAAPGGDSPNFNNNGVPIPPSNSSPGGNPATNVFSRGIGAVASRIESATNAWIQLRQGGAPGGIPGYRMLTTGNTMNTSYLGASLGGAFNTANLAARFLQAGGGSAGLATAAGAGTALAVAAAIYKGGELLTKGLSLGTAAYFGSGAAAMKTPGGQFLNDLSTVFDRINNFGGTITNAAKMTAQFDDAVAAVTGKLPDMGFYIPQFYRLADQQMQFQSMVKRNMAMTKAGAWGSSDPVDMMADMLVNALSGL